jgi:hypothetical protein
MARPKGSGGRYAGRVARLSGEHDADGAHVGWFRADRRSPWQALARGPSWREAWLRLLGALGPAGDDDQGERLVLPARQTPDEALAAAARQPPKNRWRRVEDLELER